MKSAGAIAFDYRPSRLVAAAIVAVLLLALGAIGLSGFGSWPALVLAVLAGAYAAFELRRFWRAPARRLAWQEAGHWRIADRDGHEHTAELRGAVVRGGFVALDLRSEGRRVPIVLAPDNCDADLRRRLRVRLARAADEPR